MESQTHLTPDSIVYWDALQWGPFKLNATILFTWGVMLLLVVVSLLVTRRLRSDEKIPRWQNLLEVIVQFLRNQIGEITQHQPDRYLPFIGTLLVFIAFSNLLTIVPYYQAPTASLSTTSALAICVFFAVPIFGISQTGLLNYLKTYTKPSVFMLPFNVIGEISRTIALAVRLFGNVMSGGLIVAILISIVPLFVTIPFNALGLLTGLLHAYIFALLAMVYIASATRTKQKKQEEPAEGGQQTEQDRRPNLSNQEKTGSESPSSAKGEKTHGQ